MSEPTDLGFLAAVVLAIYGWSVERRLRVIESRLSSFRARLDLLLAHFDLQYDPYKDLPPAVAEALRDGKKIEAIKRYREIAGVGLKEAKDFVEGVQRRGEY
jgi:hypothetical protein